MKLGKILLTAAMVLPMGLHAQDTETVYEFNRHWDLQLGVGAQYTLGERSFGDLISPNAQLGLGYYFNPVLGTRLTVNGWQSKAGIDYKTIDEAWKWNYVAPMLDLTVNVSNWIAGFNPERKINFGVFGGLGANIAFNNGEASDVMNSLYSTGGAYSQLSNAHKQQNMDNVWSDTKAFLVGRVGGNMDYRFNDRLSASIELSANTISDKYNSKKAKNADWYFNALAGLKIRLGKDNTAKQVPTAAALAAAAAEKAIKDNMPQEKVVEKPVEVEKIVEKIAPLRRDIYFKINSSVITKEEMQKVRDLADYLNNYPESKVEISGYADKKTGTAEINERISKKRAESVAAEIQKYGISADRIKVDYKGSTEQPYSENDLNRVTICIAQ